MFIYDLCIIYVYHIIYSLHELRFIILNFMFMINRGRTEHETQGKGITLV